MMDARGPGRWGASAPLADRRALVTSAVVHAAVLGLAALVGAAGLSASRSGGGWGRAPLRTEVERPVDNRIAEIDTDPREGAGPTGEAGARGEATDDVARADGGDDRAAAPGGEGGVGSGAGGGGGTTFFGEPEDARSIVYVIDGSGSMGEGDALGRAKAELLSSLTRLAPGARFAVIVYKYDSLPFEGEGATPGWQDATPANRARLAAWLGTIRAEGGTRPRPVLDVALAMRPEAVYFVTDGQELTARDVEVLVGRAREGATRIHAIDLGATRPQGPDAALRRLAGETGGRYRQVANGPGNGG